MFRIFNEKHIEHVNLELKTVFRDLHGVLSGKRPDKIFNIDECHVVDLIYDQIAIIIARIEFDKQPLSHVPHGHGQTNSSWCVDYSQEMSGFSHSREFTKIITLELNGVQIQYRKNINDPVGKIGDYRIVSNNEVITFEKYCDEMFKKIEGGSIQKSDFLNIIASMVETYMAENKILDFETCFDSYAGLDKSMYENMVRFTYFYAVHSKIPQIFMEEQTIEKVIKKIEVRSMEWLEEKINNYMSANKNFTGINMPVEKKEVKNNIFENKENQENAHYKHDLIN